MHVYMPKDVAEHKPYVNQKSTFGSTQWASQAIILTITSERTVEVRMRQRFICLSAVLTVLLLAASVVFAHHSVSGQFDTSKSVTLKGSIAKVQWMNPHIYVYLDVKEADGTVETWALETLPTAMMRKAGLSKESVMGTLGEIVTVVVVPSRDAKHTAWISKITYADGRYYALGGANAVQ
jgi:hypothetical protein